MKTSRIALLTGASLAAFGVATPAPAAPHDTTADGTYAGIEVIDNTAPFDDTITICDIATASPDCFLGVKNSGGSFELSTVNSVATGKVRLEASAATDVVTLSVDNPAGSSAEIGAVAIATGAAATAWASNAAFISMAASGTDDITLTVSNGGNLLLDAFASANATTAGASAFARMTSAIYQQATSLGGNADNVIENSGVATVAAVANANAPGLALATAVVSSGVFQSASATGAGNASNSLTNDAGATLNIDVTAEANGDAARANADVLIGIEQIANAGGGVATNGIVNDGTFNVTAHAAANATVGLASANAAVEHAVFQDASATGTAVAVVNNAGAINFAASATAVGEGAADAFALVGGASRFADSGAFQQFATGAVASANFINSGTVNVNALANATGTVATATGEIHNVIFQRAIATSDALAAISNSGTMRIAATAVANATGTANARVTNYRVMEQTANATNGIPVASFHNTGSVTIAGMANAAGLNAVATAAVAGVEQEANAESPAPGTAVFVNDGAHSVSAIANATAGTGTALDPVAATAGAQALGMGQQANGNAIFTNSGTFNVLASANAVAGTAAGTGANSALARVDAIGMIQFVGTGTGHFTNGGTMNVTANAVASGATGVADASAWGYQVGASGTHVINTQAVVDAVNSGALNVAANATAPGTAHAHAVGVSAHVSNTALAPAPVGGAITNSGTIAVVANAAGGTTTRTTPTAGGVTTLTAALSNATATGILIQGAAVDATITNNGTISVDAINANGDIVTDPQSAGGKATATGIRVVDTVGAPPTTEVTTINNGGDIIVRESGDGGATWVRGTAIDVTQAPNPTVINLLGGGNIYGHIAIQDTDGINVSDGETSFDGIIGPDFFPAGGVTADDLDTGLAGVGTLNILDGGTLFLRDRRLDAGFANMYDGPSYVLVDTFNVDAGGTIAFDLHLEAGGDQPVGNYPQIFANTANLEGTLEARFTTPNGLFADDYFWDNVIDADVRNGGFDGDQCVISGTYSDSLLLELDCIEDTSNNIDLAVSRVPFNEVPGLKPNPGEVGGGLECIYDTSLTGGIVDILGDLFRFTDPVNYNIALDMLSGSVYANYLQSFPSLGVHHNDLLAKATDCEIPALAGSVLECRASGPIHVWGQADYQWRKADGDMVAGTTKARRFSGLLGVDANVGGAAVLGGAVGYVTNHVKDRRFGDKADADGYQVGLYGTYDPGAFYVKAMGSYSWYDGDSIRHIDFRGLAPGATFNARPEGDPDVKMWTAGVHGGYRFPLDETSVATPYLNLDFVRAKLETFTETNGNGAELKLKSGKVNSTFLTAGVKWAKQLDDVVSEVNVGYRYRFGDRRSRFTACFLGGGDPACTFDILSAAQKRGTILVGLSVGGKLGAVDLRIGYEGEFNRDITSHSGNFKFVLPLGAKAAPPPPPPPVEAAPPPPPPPTQTCPDGSVVLASDTCPAPPPPPVEPPPTPERG